MAQARVRLEQPTPRVALGLALRGIASAAIDVSDGLLGDLGHVLKASNCGATIDTSIVTELLAACRHSGNANAADRLQLSHEQRLSYVLAGGDDYELLFTAPGALRAAVETATRTGATPVTRIGRVDAEPGLRLIDAQGKPVGGRFASFDHFA
jgi:thiamine-monophosphate kinase